MSEWAKMDAVAAHRFVRERFGSAERVVLVGHSFGGQLLGLVDEALDTAGAVLVGSQLGYYGSWPLVPRVKLALAWRVVPQLTSLYGYLPGKVFGMREDLPRGVATEWARWCTHPDYFMADHGDARARFARFRGPLRFYNFTDDAYAPETAVRRLASCFDETKLERVVVAPRDHGGGRIGHFGFFRRRFRDSLWLDTVQFVKDVAGGTAVRPARYGVRETSVSRRRRKEPYVRIDEKDIRADLDAGRP
jgi:predicted alpha/beta hydrolase